MALPVDPELLSLFEDEGAPISFCIHETVENQEDLVHQIRLFGGFCTGAIKTCDYVISESPIPEPDLRNIQQNAKPCVLPAWITQCIERKELTDPGPFTLYAPDNDDYVDDELGSDEDPSAVNTASGVKARLRYTDLDDQRIAHHLAQGPYKSYENTWQLFHEKYPYHSKASWKVYYSKNSARLIKLAKDLNPEVDVVSPMKYKSRGSLGAVVRGGRGFTSAERDALVVFLSTHPRPLSGKDWDSLAKANPSRDSNGWRNHYYRHAKEYDELVQAYIHQKPSSAQLNAETQASQPPQTISLSSAPVNITLDQRRAMIQFLTTINTPDSNPDWDAFAAEHGKGPWAEYFRQNRAPLLAEISHPVAPVEEDTKPFIQAEPRKYRTYYRYTPAEELAMAKHASNPAHIRLPAIQLWTLFTALPDDQRGSAERRKPTALNQHFTMHRDRVLGRLREAGIVTEPASGTSHPPSPGSSSLNAPIAATVKRKRVQLTLGSQPQAADPLLHDEPPTKRRQSSSSSSPAESSSTLPSNSTSTPAHVDQTRPPIPYRHSSTSPAPSEASGPQYHHQFLPPRPVTNTGEIVLHYPEVVPIPAAPVRPPSSSSTGTFGRLRAIPFPANTASASSPETSAPLPPNHRRTTLQMQHPGRAASPPHVTYNHHRPTASPPAPGSTERITFPTASHSSQRNGNGFIVSAIHPVWHENNPVSMTAPREGDAANGLLSMAAGGGPIPRRESVPSQQNQDVDMSDASHGPAGTDAALMRKFGPRERCSLLKFVASDEFENGHATAWIKFSEKYTNNPLAYDLSQQWLDDWLDFWAIESTRVTSFIDRIRRISSSGDTTNDQMELDKPLPNSEALSDTFSVEDMMDVIAFLVNVDPKERMDALKWRGFAKTHGQRTTMAWIHFHMRHEAFFAEVVNWACAGDSEAR